MAGCKTDGSGGMAAAVWYTIVMLFLDAKVVCTSTIFTVMRPKTVKMLI